MRIALALASVLVVLAACSNSPTDAVIGAPCAVDGDCAHRCFTDNGDHFPGGFCSESCATDADCPNGASCVDVAGGVCMFDCPPFDCAFMGPGWQCDNRDRRSGGGQVNVCIGH